MRKYIIYSMFLVLSIDIMFGFGFGIGFGLSVKNLYLYAVVLSIVLESVVRPRGLEFADLDVHAAFLLLIAYAALTWLLLSMASPTYHSLKGLITLKNQLVDKYLYMFVFCYGVKTREDMLWLMKMLMGTLAVLSFITMIDFFDIPNLGIVGDHKGRVEGPVGEANQYGALLVFLIPLLFAMVMQSSGWARRFWQIGIAVNLLMLLATGSRGAWVSVIVGFPMAAFYLRRFLDPRQVVRYGLIGLSSVIVLGIVMVIARPELLSSILEKSTGGNIEQMSSGRLDVWRSTILVMLEQPLTFIFGYGWGSYLESGIFMGSHSVYIRYLFELGIIGVVLFLHLVWRLLARTRRAIFDAKYPATLMFMGYAFGLVGLAIAIVAVAIPRPWMIFWSVTGIVIGLQRLALAEQPVAQPR